MSPRRRPAFPGPTADELAALDALGTKGTWELQGRALALTNLDKVLAPPAAPGGPPVTKRDLVRHVATIAPLLMPYLAGRPVNQLRHPDGVLREGFWQKAVPDHGPDWLHRWRNVLADPGETEWYLVPDGAPSLVWLANFGAVELHPWTSTAADPHEPRWALIDVDPGERTTWDEVVLLAGLYEVALRELQVVAQPKVTGKRGIQIWVPVRRGYTFADTRSWVEQVSLAIGRVVPQLVSWSWRKEDRRGLARLDYTQNAINKTLVAPWSTRAAPGMPVSVPISWSELHEPWLRSDGWPLHLVAGRVATAGDPFARLLGVEQDLPGL